ncbi:hypothetical protein Tco_0858975 [Tanacetum coccineum]|uniref:Uncharacterized protein n=1 Tax=Tanacetum coccineum TaxID=301880 RepID=A0ABQ5BBP1_9ASTR
MVFNQMEAAVEQCFVDKKYFEIEKKELVLEHESLLIHIICQDVNNVVMHANDHKVSSMNTNCLDNDNRALECLEFFIINDLQSHLKAKNVSIKNLKKHIANLTGKNVVECVENVNKSNVEHTDTLRDIVEQAKALTPLDNSLDYALKSSTEASRSKSRSNTKNNRISQTSSSNKKHNKVEDQSRIVKSSLNNVNCISNTSCNVNVKHYVLNANSELICATCNECMFDAIHDSCVRVYLNDVNARVKSKSVKSVKSNKKKVWKSTGKIFTNVGYRWIPTRRTFTIDGNTCPLPRIISTKVVPPRKSTSPIVVKQTKPDRNNSWKIKDITNVGSSSKSKTVATKISNNLKPMQNWGFNVSTAPSFSVSISGRINHTLVPVLVLLQPYNRATLSAYQLRYQMFVYN